MSTTPIPQLMGVLGLSFAPAMIAAERFRADLLKTEAGVKRLQRTMNNPQLAAGLVAQKEMVNLKHRESLITKNLAMADLSRAKSQAILARAGQQALATKSQELAAQQRLVQAQMQQQRLQATQLAQEAARLRLLQQQSLVTGNINNQMSSIENFAGRRISWFVSGAAIFGGAAAISQTLGMISSVEYAMTRIRKVSSEQFSDFNKLRDSLIDIGIQYGATADQVLDSATIWAQAGYKIAEVEKLTDISLQIQLTGDMNADEAAKYMISALKQFNMEIEDATEVADKINHAYNNFAITAKDAYEAISVSGQMAKNAGMSFDELLGYIVALREATGRPGREIGNSIRSIIAFSQRPSSIEFFEELGVNVIDAQDNYRSFTEVFEELSKKWTGATADQVAKMDELSEAYGLVVEGEENLTDVEKTRLAQAGANMFRRNQFISLMERYGDVTKATTEVGKGLGSMERELEILTESHRVKVLQLKATYAALAVQIGDAGYLNVMKSVADGTKDALTAFNSLPDPIKNAVILITTLGGVLALVNLTMKIFAGTGIGGMLIGLANLSLGLTGATYRVIALGAALKVLALNPYVAGFTLLTGAVILATNQIKKQKQELDDLIKSFNNSADSARDKVTQLEKLRDEYKALAENTEKTAEQQDRQRQVFEKIVELVPNASLAYDSHGNAVESTGKVYSAVTDEINRNTEAIQRNMEMAARLAQLRMPEAKRELSEAQRELDAAAAARETGPKLPKPGPSSTDRSGLLGKWLYSPHHMEKIEQAYQEKLTVELAKLDDKEADALEQFIEKKEYVDSLTKTIVDSMNLGPQEWDMGTYPWGAEKGSGKQFIPRDTWGADGEGSSGSGSPTKLPTWLETFTKGFDKAIPPGLIESLLQVEATLAATSRQTDMLAWSQDNLTEKLTNNQITAAEYTDLQHTLQQRLFLTKQQTDALAAQNDTLTQQLPYLNSQLKVAADRYDAMTAAQNVDEQYAALEAYDKTVKAIQAIEDKIHTNNQALAEAARQTEEFKLQLKAMGEIGWESAYQLEQRLNDLRNPFQAYIDYVRKARELEHKAEIERIETERDAAIKALEDRRDAYIEASNARIAAWQAELDAMALERELNKEAEELAERKEELLKAQQRLANLEADTRVLNERGEWEYIIDPAKLAQAQADVAQAEKALAETQENIAYNARHRELQDLISHEREQQRIQTESYNKQIENQKEHWETKITEANTFWESLLEEERIRGEAWLEHTRGTLDRSLEMWREHYNKLDAMAQESWGNYGVSSGPSGGGGGGSSSGDSDSDSPSWDGSSGTPWDSGYGSYDDWADAGFPSYDKGGPIERTGLAMVHAGEYMLTRKDVQDLNVTPQKVRDAVNTSSKEKETLTNLINNSSHVSRLEANNTQTNNIEKFSSHEKLPSYDKGGPIHQDQIAQIHAGEYILKSEIVQSMGGLSAVDRFVATLPDSNKMPLDADRSQKYAIPRDIIRSLGLSTTTPSRELAAHIARVGGNQSTVTHIDKSTKLMGDVKIQHVRDVSAFIRYLKMYAR